MWGNWGSWSTCSETCGTSVMKRVRAKDMGPCDGKWKEYETERVSCPVGKCPANKGIEMPLRITFSYFCQQKGFH